MKNKNHHHHKTIHQRVDQMLRHRASVIVVLFLMLLGVSTFDNRVRMLLQEAYAQGWGWIGTYMHHEHPAHSHNAFNHARLHTISGPG
jgi:hypothetical protein